MRNIRYGNEARLWNQAANILRVAPPHFPDSHNAHSKFCHGDDPFRLAALNRLFPMPPAGMPEFSCR